MRKRPILLSSPMVRALLDGSKTQTRRVVKPQPVYDGRFAGGWKLKGKKGHEAATCSPLIAEVCPYGQPGDRLWVRETFQWFSDDGEIMYRADPESLDAMNELKRDECLEAVWRPSIHMPRWASRITLEITSVRVERLRDISEADAIAEGCTTSGQIGPSGIHVANNPLGAYVALWRGINGPDSWEANPWVWVIDFKRINQAAA